MALLPTQIYTKAHWLPRHGKPTSASEWFTQWLIRTLAYLPIYIAVVVTLTLIIVLWGTR